MAETRMTILPKLLHCGRCGEDIHPDEACEDLNPAHPEYEEFRHVRDCPPWEPRGPISDGTLQCPKWHEDRRCIHKIPKGWRENEGHSGGHWFHRDDLTEAMKVGHYDPIAALSCQPFTVHQPEDCRDPWECQEKGWSRG